MVKCIQSWLLLFNGVATRFFDHCASSGVVSEMLASGKYPLRVPEALKFCFHVGSHGGRCSRGAFTESDCHLRPVPTV